MSRQLFVQNLLPTITEQQLRTLFAEIGRVVEIQRPVDRETGKPRRFAFITMEDEQAGMAAIERLNGHQLEGQALAVMAAKPRKPKPAQKKEVFDLAKRIAAKLQETDKRPRTQIRRIIEECGAEFAQQLLDDTLKIEAEEGLMTLDGKRKRTRGGIFFKLAKDRMPAETRADIFPNWREIKQRLKARRAAERVDKPAGDGARPKSGDPTAPAEVVVDPKVEAAKAAAQKRKLVKAKKKLLALRESEKSAQQRLTAIQSGRIQGGMFEALKEVAEIKGKIAALQKTHPELE